MNTFCSRLLQRWSEHMGISLAHNSVRKWSSVIQYYIVVHTLPQVILRTTVYTPVVVDDPLAPHIFQISSISPGYLNSVLERRSCHTYPSAALCIPENLPRSNVSMQLPGTLFFSIHAHIGIYSSTKSRKADTPQSSSLRSSFSPKHTARYTSCSYPIREIILRTILEPWHISHYSSETLF